MRTLYRHSHYQGTTDEPLGTVPAGIDATALVDALSTCSFCRPGRAAQYATGRCYYVRQTRQDYGPLSDELLDQAAL